MPRHTLTTLAAAAVTMASPMSGFAATFTWSGAGSDANWTTGANWGGTAPNPVDTIDVLNFPDAPTAFPNTMDATWTIATLNVNNGSDTYATNLGGNTLTVSGITTVNGPDNNLADITFSNGTFQPTTLRIAYGNNGVGNGRVTVTGTFDSTNLGSVSVGESTTTQDGNNKSGTLDLSGATLVSGAQANRLTMSNLFVGYAKQASGQVLLPSSMTHMTVTGTMALGDLTSANDQLLMPADSTLTVGTISTPGNLRVGYLAGASAYSPTGKLGWAAGTGNTLVANLDTLDVGFGAGSVVTDNATGELDLSNVTLSGGALTVNNLRIGSASSNNAATGNLILSTSTGLTSLTVRDDLMLGYNTKSGTGRIGDANGILPNAVNIVLGNGTSDRGRLLIGQKTSAGNPTGGTSDGKLETVGGTFQAHLSEMVVGRNLDTGTNGTPRAVGLLDLRDSTFVGDGLDVSGAVTIGVQTAGENNTNQSGRVYLPAGPASAGSIVVGSPATFNNMIGLLDLTGTTFEVQTTLTLDATGDIVSRIGSTSSGIDLVSSNASDFVINTGGLMNIIFTADPTGSELWGLRMAGDQTSLFNTYQTDGRLTWDVSALSPANQALIGIHYLAGDDVTIVGLIPEPGTLALALAGALLMLPVRGRRQRVAE